MSARLACVDLAAGHGSTTAFRAVDLSIGAGETLAVLGPNGAGKTTLLMTLAGLLPAKAGTVTVEGAELRNGQPAAANRAGVVLVPDNRCLFTAMTVEENLRVAAPHRGPDPRTMLDVFPALESRWRVRAGALSGGEQQMLAVARAFIQQPKVLLIDELSMGLAPLVVTSLFISIGQIATEHGCAILLVEQHANLALAAATKVVVLNHGGVVLRGSAAELADQPARLEEAYFGAAIGSDGGDGREG